MNPDVRETLGYCALFLIFTGLTGSFAGGFVCTLLAALLIEILNPDQ